MDIQNSFMDIQNSFMNIHKWILDIHNYWVFRSPEPKAQGDQLSSPFVRCRPLTFSCEHNNLSNY